MQNIKNKAAAGLCALLAVCVCVPFSACKNKNQPEPEPDKYTAIGAESDFLKAEGELVKNRSGEAIALRGVNAGGLFVTEHWMTGFTYGTQPHDDYKSLTKTFIERFDEQKTKALWAEYRANWWTETDFKNCADMGMNVIRLPFTYMNVDFAAITDYENAGKSYDFSALDAFVERAAAYGMYTILDLHGAYGSQSGQDHSGEIKDYTEVDFYSNEQMINLTVKLWDALSEHYKNNAAVAGYDILNEPGERKGNGNDGVQSTEKRHWDVFDKIYDAIRENGDNHMVIFESCWNGENLPAPEQYGWENCMYSFHHYTGNTDQSDGGILDHNLSWNDKIANVTARNFGIPLQMGEFTSYESPQKWEYTLELMNREGWHWVSWTYKVWGSMPWGVVNIMGSNREKVNADTDSYEDILNKFKVLRTDGEKAQKYTFYKWNAQGERVMYKTLEELYGDFTRAPAVYEKIEAGDYGLYYGDDYTPLTVGAVSRVLELSSSAYDRMTFTVRYHSSGDGSAHLSVYGVNLGVSDSGNTLSLSGSSGSETRFYPVVSEDGVAFISRSTCKYLRVDENGTVRADGEQSQAATFYLEQSNEN